MSTLVNLWPEEIVYQRVKAPVVILREQAAMLGLLTKNLVQGEVLQSHTATNSHNDMGSLSFEYTFFINAPSLGNYRYQLLRIAHGITMYPVDIFIEDAMLSEILQLAEEHLDKHNKVRVETEEKFMETLKAIFETRKARDVIIALLSQADPKWHTEEEIRF